MTATSTDGLAAATVPAIELREIAVLLALAEELHFGHAADRLQLNRSRVSQIINTIETRIGGRLFERTSRRVRFTPLGEQLASELAGPYGQLCDILISAREAARGVAGQLRIGIYAMSAGPHMSEIVGTFETRHPDCEVAFVNVGYDRRYLDMLRAREVDMLAPRLPLTEPDVTVGPILSREEPCGDRGQARPTRRAGVDQL